MTSEGKPYAPERYKSIVEERYQISKRIHTSYVDLGSVTPRERDILLSLIREDLEHDNKLVEELHRNK